MATTLPPTPPSPGVGTRRKGPKNLPRLPLSAFSPPNSGTGEKFPLPPSPSTVHPEGVIDGSVSLLDGDLAMTRWKMEAGSVLGGRIGGVVVTLANADVAAQLQASTPVLRVVVPFSLDSLDHQAPVNSAALTTSFTKVTANSVASLRWALQQGCPVEIAVTVPFTDDLFESFEDLLSKALTDLDSVPPIILSNLLPPADDLSLPIVKLMNHPTYRAFQGRTAALSLIPQLFIKFLPPTWEQQIPETPSILSPAHHRRAGKRRNGNAGSRCIVSVYSVPWNIFSSSTVGPVMEAFGYERIIFGSSAAGSGRGMCGAGEWYEIARESLAELAVEQDAINAVFCNTAKRVYTL
ncbi:hypothetical protein BDZ89DRAFT_1068791 [Hymenopellis radicata]|nr:hypothetical protein BDZ89DRAFT_1068791 [Hymenopellis radicata]